MYFLVILKIFTEHQNNISDFADPFVMPGAKKSTSSSFTPNEEALMMIMSMGFTRDQGIKALKATVST